MKYVCVCVGGSDNGGCGEEGRGENGSEPPPMSPVLAEYIADARKKVEELRNKADRDSPAHHAHSCVPQGQ